MDSIAGSNLFEGYFVKRLFDMFFEVFVGVVHRARNLVFLVCHAAVSTT